MVIELEAIRETRQHETPVSYANLATDAPYWCCQMLNLLAAETNIIGSHWCGPITRGDQYDIGGKFIALNLFHAKRNSNSFSQEIQTQCGFAFPPQKTLTSTINQ